MARGLVEGLLALSIPLLPVAYLFGRFDIEPGSDLLLAVAQIGATLLVAFAVVVTGLVRVSHHRPRSEREERLGAFLGVGAGGLAGVFLALALSARADAGHWIWVDTALLAWIAISTLMLGVLVVMQPLVEHEWTPRQPRWKSSKIPRAPIRRRRS